MTFNNYTVIKEETVPALNGQGIILKHNKSGANLFIVSNDDNNKVFNVIFRTPPIDDTGLPHILEHSVLCGSRKYPVKDPFVELAKGSLNTFLNAMTYPDKTMYPLASCNSKDFRNLTDVYLDAVYYPNIYKDERILQQEGWHYELAEGDSSATINGVVYNEMKGASSSPEQVLFRKIQTALFPDSPYGLDSGGVPEAIPELTQKDFEAFHSSYYHPSNSYIYIYGDMDVEEQLKWLDEAYLGEFDAIEVNSNLTKVAAPEKMIEMTESYAIGNDESDEGKVFLSYNTAIDSFDNFYDSVGMEVIEYLLMDAPGALLKESLLGLGIAEDVFGSYDSGLLQPTFSIVAKNTELEHERVFVETIKSSLKAFADNGIEKRKLEAAINIFEFKFREADFGQYPKGVIYSIKAMDTWLYGGDPIDNFRYDTIFEGLRAGLDNGYFEELIRKYLLNNNHKALLRLVPDNTLALSKQKILDEKLKAFTDSLSEDGRDALLKSTADLKDFQTEPNAPEELEKLPLLELDDIDKKATPIHFDVFENGGVEYISHKTFTNDIVYAKLMFDFSMLTFEDIPYVGLLLKFLTRVGTKKYTVSELTDEINILTGGINASVNIYGLVDNPNECKPRLEVKFKCFSASVDKSVALVKEIILNTLFDDYKRMGDLINEVKSRLTMNLIRSGHTASITRSLSYHTLNGKYKDMLEGIGYYRFIEGIQEKDVEKVAAKVEAIRDRLMMKTNLSVLINADAEKVPTAYQALSNMIDGLPLGIELDDTSELMFETLNEGFKTSSKVQYCALTGDYAREGYKYSGTMKVLQTIMSLDYMWKEVRIKGGAYGGFGGFRKNGVFYLASYRDPNLADTYEIYKQLPEYIRSIELSDRELTKYIIGTVSGLDAPLTPMMKGERAAAMHMSSITNENDQQERNEVLGANNEALNSIADLIDAVIAQSYLCVVGNEEKIEEDKDILNTVETLFK